MLQKKRVYRSSDPRNSISYKMALWIFWLSMHTHYTKTQTHTAILPHPFSWIIMIDACMDWQIRYITEIVTQSNELLNQKKCRSLQCISDFFIFLFPSSYPLSRSPLLFCAIIFPPLFLIATSDDVIVVCKKYATGQKMRLATTICGYFYILLFCWHFRRQINK